MAGKARVHELARELGVTSKEVLARLSEAGEFVKSASSTVDGPVARRLRAAYGIESPTRTSRGAGIEGPASVAAETPPAAPDHGSAPPRRRHLTTSQVAGICKDYQQAGASQNRNAAINRLYLKYEALYGVSRATLRELISADQRRRRATEYTALRTPNHHQQPQRQRTAGASAAATTGARARNRVAGLPPVTAAIQPAIVGDIVVGTGASQTAREDVVTCLRSFDPRGADGYGYLAWRYGETHRRLYSELPSRTANDELGAIAQVVDVEKQLLDQVVHAHGAILEHPGLAERAVDAEYRDLTDSDDIGRSAADELRRVRAKSHFLRRAVVLTIASPGHDDRLWEILGRIRPPIPSELVESTPQLVAAIDGLTDRITAVEALLAADEPVLERFLRRSHSELLALQAGRYDFLQQFRDVGSPSRDSRHPPGDLPFVVMPQGEQLRAFLGGMRSSGVYRGHRVDVKRLSVLEELEKHFGADTCNWYEGSESSTGVDNHYLVLTIKSPNGSGENAVAISPLAGQHATYVVRRECAEGHWADIFASAKVEARHRGARRLLFTATATDSHCDQYAAMRDKVVTLLECQPGEFGKRLAFDQNSRRYRMI